MHIFFWKIVFMHEFCEPSLDRRLRRLCELTYQQETKQDKKIIFTWFHVVQYEFMSQSTVNRYPQSTIWSFLQFTMKVDFFTAFDLLTRVVHTFQGLRLVFMMLKWRNRPHQCLRNIEKWQNTKFSYEMEHGKAFVICRYHKSPCQ